MEINYLPFTELLSEIVDNRGRTCPTAGFGIPLIATNCIKNESLYPAYEKVRYVSQETYDTWFRGHPKPGDLIFVLKGTPGRVCLVPDPIDFCIAQDMVAIRANESIIYSKYLFAMLRSDEIQNKIENMHVGTLIPHFKKGDFERLLLPVLDRKTQEIIGDFYFDLSEKIELNRRMNATLESMARAVFRQWFVEGKDVGKWEIGKLGDVGENIRRGASPEDIEPNTPYIALEHMPRGSIALSDWDNANGVVSNKFSFKQGEFLFGKLRPYFHKVGIAPLDGVCSTDILVIAPKSPDWYGFVLGHISSIELINFTNAASTGTKMPRTNWSDIARYEVVIPPIKVAKEFNEMFKPMAQQIRANIMQSHTLVSLRDTLLPKLMRGEVRVSAP